MTLASILVLRMAKQIPTLQYVKDEAGAMAAAFDRIFQTRAKSCAACSPARTALLFSTSWSVELVET